MSFAPGDRVGSFEVIGAIGAGGMGEVYRVRDTRLNRDAAIKVLPDAVGRDAERLARFQREAQILASFNHPNIAQIHGLEQQDHQLALVMELVEGPTLEEMLYVRPGARALELEPALAIARQIALALEAAHEQGIVHRDLKPANVKVRDDGCVKVLDFGLAKAFDPAPAASSIATASPTLSMQATLAGVILGTAAYMSPEQAAAKPVDKRSDIWSFGVVLYEMLTGRRLFHGETISHTLADVLRAEIDFSKLPSDTPLSIRTLLRRCLDRDVKRRLRDIGEARIAIDQAATEPAVVAAPATLAAVASRPVWRRVLPAAVSAIAAAVIVAGAAWMLRPRLAAAPIARFAFALPQDQGLSNAARQIMAISPDGTLFVYVANNRLFLRSIGDLDARAIPGTENPLALHSPAFSPDGQSLVFHADGALKRIAITGGAAVTVCPAEAPTGVSWDPSGIVFGQLTRGVFRCSPNGGTAEQLVRIEPTERVQGPQLLPDGERVLFSLAKGADGPAMWDRARIVLQNLKSGERKTLLTGGSDARYLPTGHVLYALGGVMFAVPFDMRGGAVTGGPVPVVDGVRRKRSQVTGAADLVTSSTGTLVYVPGPSGAATNLRELAIADRSGAITRLKTGAGGYIHVRASPDGKRLAVETEEGSEAIVWIHATDESIAPRRLTLEGRNRSPIWSPDGQRVAFQSDRGGDLSIYMQRADGTSPAERLTTADKETSHVPQSWSPDGKTIAFASVKGGYTLMMLSLDTRKAEPFANVQSSEPIEAVFSPDGRFIAYTSAQNIGGNSPNRGVFVRQFPAGTTRFQVPKRGLDFHPLWSPDGQQLLWIPSGASGLIASVRVTTQPSVSFGAPETFPAKVTGERLSGETRIHDILPDGRFVGVANVAGGETPSLAGAGVQFRIVLNWFDELRQRVPIK